MVGPSTTDPNGRLKCGCVKVITVRKAVGVIYNKEYDSYYLTSEMFKPNENCCRFK